MCNEMQQSQGYITRGIITGQMGRRGTILDRINVNPHVLLASLIQWQFLPLLQKMLIVCDLKDKDSKKKMLTYDNES